MPAADLLTGVYESVMHCLLTPYGQRFPLDTAASRRSRVVKRYRTASGSVFTHDAVARRVQPSLRWASLRGKHHVADAEVEWNRLTTWRP